MIRKVLVNAGWASAATPFTAIIGIVQIGMMARMLGPEGLGAIALFTAVSALVGGVIKLNSSQAALTYVTQAIEAKNLPRGAHIVRYCYALDVLTGLLALAVLAGLSLAAPVVLDLNPGQITLQIVFGLTILFQSTYLTSQALLRIADRFSWTFYHSVAQSLVKLAAVACLFYFDAGLSEVVWLLVCMSLINGLSLYLMARVAMRGIKITGSLLRGQKLPKWWQVSGEIRRFQTLGYGNSVAKVLSRNLDVLLIGTVGTVGTVGIYRAAAQFASLLDIPVQALSTAMSPEVSRLWFSGEKERLRKLVIQSTVLSIGAIGVALAIFIPLSGQIISMVYGDAFSSGREIFVVLVFATLVSALMVPLNTVQYASGQAGPATLASTATVLTQAVLLLWLIPMLGIIAAAWARVGALIASLTIMLPTGILRLRACPNNSNRAKD